jgi:putative ABC transport system permease protein
VLVVILAEVLILGMLGVAVGIPLGYLAATLNVDAVSATLTNLYLLSEIERLELPAWTFLTAAGAGVLGAILGALVPAVDMARRDTKSLLAAYTLLEKTRSVAPHLFLAGVGILSLAGAWYGLYGHTWQPSGFILATALVVSLPLLAPAAVETLTRHVSIRSFDMRFSLRSLGASLQSTSVAVAALSIAVTLLVGITLMVGSFRQTLAP